MEETFSKAVLCAACATAAKVAQAVEAERRHLGELGYTVTGEPTLNAHRHRVWPLRAPCCGGAMTPTYGNVLKQLASHGKPPCTSCGGKARVRQALAAYVAEHGATYDLTEYRGYARKVRRLTGRTYAAWRHVINPLDHPRGRSTGFWHLDHKVPVIWCFKHGVPPEVAAAPQNLQMLPVQENLRKGRRLLSDEEAAAVLRESAVSQALFTAVGEAAKARVEVVADTTNVWTTAPKLVVREGELRAHPEGVAARVRYHLGQVTSRVGARTLRVDVVPRAVERAFLDRWHVQGAVASHHACGLWRGDELLSLMTMARPRYRQAEAELELLRFCSHGEHLVPGAASRLFQHLTATLTPRAVVSYSLNRWGDGGLYRHLGFTQVRVTPSASYLWRVDGRLRGWRASVLKARREGVPHAGGEIEGTVKVHDPGSTTWLWRRPAIARNE